RRLTRIDQAIHVPRSTDRRPRRRRGRSNPPVGAGAALTARGSDALKFEFEKARAGDRVGDVRRDLAEAESRIERLGLFHPGDRVGADASVAEPPRFGKRAFGERATGPFAPARGTDVEALQLAGLRVERA